jgi:low affinity Fe/Cu permease
MTEWFRKFVNAVSEIAGSPWVFIAATGIIAAWATSGPIFHFSDTWQLVINTGTTIVTFLMVFLIQNTQTRDATAIHLKLDELLRAQGGTEQPGRPGRLLRRGAEALAGTGRAPSRARPSRRRVG